MDVKIDTKEKFHEVQLLEPHLTANMTADLNDLLSELQITPPKNVVLNLKDVNKIDPEAAVMLAKCQGEYYDNSHSFVICLLSGTVETDLDEMGVLEVLNVTPTLSEAWDIVQMEEIERELLDGLED
jgi:anti-anti-sigma regulatory factor